MVPAAPIRVALVEDDSGMREGLALLIGGTPGYRCVGTFSTVEDALDAKDQERPDVLLLDIHLPGMLGSEGVRLLKDRYPGMQVLMLTVYGSEDKIFESLCNGASGYLLKKTPPAELLEAIGDAHAGGSPMSSEIARKVVALLRQTRATPDADESLTPQEVKLLGLLAEGYSYQACGAHLNISINTVRDHIRSIYDKLQVHTRSEAVSKGLRRKIIQ
jgi:DNA-binding NarL/FixJ family response regulator